MNPLSWLVESLPLLLDLAWVPPILLASAIGGLLVAAGGLLVRVVTR